MCSQQLWLESTLSHRFEDYDVYHSRCDVAVGGVLQPDWCYQGTVAGLFHLFFHDTEAHRMGWLGRTCIFMFVCRGPNGSITIYSRNRDTIPENRYYQYTVWARWPQFWRARTWEFVDYVDWHE